MMIIKECLILIVAFIHIYFLYLEMFLWTKPKGRKAFGLSIEKAQTTKVLAANQGLYNGFLAAGLVWSFFEKNSLFSNQLSLFFLSCVGVAGIYGAISLRSKKVFWIQSFPALAALIFVFFSF